MYRKKRKGKAFPGKQTCTNIQRQNSAVDKVVEPIAVVAGENTRKLGEATTPDLSTSRRKLTHFGFAERLE